MLVDGRETRSAERFVRGVTATEWLRARDAELCEKCCARGKHQRIALLPLEVVHNWAPISALETVCHRKWLQPEA